MVFQNREPAMLSAEAFLAAEDAYVPYLPPGFCGTISLEPLVSSEPGPPVYLSRRLTTEQRRAYSIAMTSVRARFQKLLPDIPEKGARRSPRDRIRFILRACDNVQRDLAEMASQA